MPGISVATITPAIFVTGCGAVWNTTVTGCETAIVVVAVLQETLILGFRRRFLASNFRMTKLLAVRALDLAPCMKLLGMKPCTRRTEKTYSLSARDSRGTCAPSSRSFGT